MEKLPEFTTASSISSSLNRPTSENASSLPQLFPERITTRFPFAPQGADTSFYCATASGHFYAKDDRDGRLIRATEWLCTRLARELGFATPDITILEDDRKHTYFGSHAILSSQNIYDVRDRLLTPTLDETGRPISSWWREYLSGLYAYDLFINNPDRGFNNFLLYNEGLRIRLLIIDHASADIKSLDSIQFPVAKSNTVRDGRALRRFHGFDPDAASKILNEIGSIGPDRIGKAISDMPSEWMDKIDRDSLWEAWSSKKLGQRISALQRGLSDETLL